MDYYVVIPAAGIGKRMGAGKNKLLIELNQKPVLIHTLQVFEKDDWCKGVILVTNESDQQQIKSLITEYHIKKIKAIVPGGKERQQSVFAGLKVISEESIVLVHDGARPFVKVNEIHNLIHAATTFGAAILAVPVKDTVKTIRDGKVEETIDRSLLWSAQTPQAFQLSNILLAHNEAERDGFMGTDDASLLERLGKSVIIVEGSYDNIKITTPEDLYFAQAIMKKNEGFY